MIRVSVPIWWACWIAVVLLIGALDWWRLEMLP